MSGNTISVDFVRKMISELDVEMQAIEERLDAARIERKALAGLLNGVTRAARRHTLPKEKPTKLGPTAAVKEFVRKHPGVTRPEVIDALEDVISSESSDIRRLIYMTITNSIRIGHLREDNKKLYAATG